MLAAVRTRIASRQLPIFLGFHEAHLRTALWLPSIGATVDPGVELVKSLPLTPIHLLATNLHLGNVCRNYRCVIVGPLLSAFGPIRNVEKFLAEISRNPVYRIAQDVSVRFGGLAVPCNPTASNRFQCLVHFYPRRSIWVEAKRAFSVSHVFLQHARMSR